jgi:hypothetical protein
MVAAGVIDKEKFIALYEQRGALRPEDRVLLEDGYDGSLEITGKNADVALNLLWAFGLANANPVLTEGPMQDSRYGGAGNFASTGGWQLARGDAMDHYGAHQWVTLSDDEQRLVEEVAKNIYRPCCNNPVYFPDCNHGMAMLGMLELLASEGVNEEELYAAALEAQRAWFPSTYRTIDTFLAQQRREGEVSAKELLGSSFSSATGYQNILARVSPVNDIGISCAV